MTGTIFDELKRQAERARFMSKVLGEPWTVPEGPAKIHQRKYSSYNSGHI